MSLKIRLSRTGCKKNPHYRIVVIPSQKARDGQAIDIIGHYHPTTHNDKRVVIQSELFEKYINNGAQPTETVAKLAVNAGIEMARKFIPVYAKSDNHGKTKKELKTKK
ncbi:MAG: hypothetical protein RL208_651 [Pseudomonadota bacterium]|jgi:small subunit ribosomal protein S16